MLSLAVVDAARRLGIGPTEFGQIVGVSHLTATRLLQGILHLGEGEQQWERCTLLVRLYGSLISLVGGDENLARGWLRSGNRAFSGQQPIELITQIDGLGRVCEYLDSHCA